MLVYCKSSFKPKKKSKKPVAKAKKFVPSFKPMREIDFTAGKYRATDASHIPSKIESFLAEHAPTHVIPTKYHGELAVREAIAQEEIARKAKCVAPLYSKGAYQYLATEEQAKWVGRK
tara:strand:- start:2655 stop:3008 length:354 start_codon:yes stop_codon:yes gene_type:complete